MFRLTFNAARPARILAQASKSNFRGISSTARLYKHAPSSKDAPKSSQGSKGSGLLWPTVLVGAAALALTYYNYNKPGKLPRASLDPKAPHKDLDSKEVPLFKPGEVSIVYVLGGPGAGKGTQCARLVADYGFIHLSAGDLLRAEQKDPDSKEGELIANCIKNGEIVPQEITIALLKKAIVKNYNTGSSRFLVDGFPRKMDQALTFDSTVAAPKCVLFIECPEQVMLKRLLNRGKTSGRADDNIESIKKRFKTFEDTSMPVVDYYGKEGKVITVSCDQSVDAVYAQTVSSLQKQGVIPEDEVAAPSAAPAAAA